MTGLIEKIKNFFAGKFVCKTKKSAQPAGGESKPQEEEPKTEEKTEQEPF